VPFVLRPTLYARRIHAACDDDEEDDDDDDGDNDDSANQIEGIKFSCLSQDVYSRLHNTMKKELNSANIIRSTNGLASSICRHTTQTTHIVTCTYSTVIIREIGNKYYENA
jgi:hypothetical protein